MRNDSLWKRWFLNKIFESEKDFRPESFRVHLKANKNVFSLIVILLHLRWPIEPKLSRSCFFMDWDPSSVFENYQSCRCLVPSTTRIYVSQRVFCVNESSQVTKVKPGKLCTWHCAVILNYIKSTPANRKIISKLNSLTPLRFQCEILLQMVIVPNVLTATLLLSGYVNLYKCVWYENTLKSMMETEIIHH